MNKRDKLLKKFRSLPKDFTFEELQSLFSQFGFCLENKGTTSGSRVIFVNDKTRDAYIMHKPHPKNIIKGYQMRQVYDFLISKGYIKQEDK